MSWQQDDAVHRWGVGQVEHGAGLVIVYPKPKKSSKRGDMLIWVLEALFLGSMEISSEESCEFTADDDEVKMEGDKAMKYLGLGELDIYS